MRFLTLLLAAASSASAAALRWDVDEAGGVEVTSNLPGPSNSIVARDDTDVVSLQLHNNPGRV